MQVLVQARLGNPCQLERVWLSILNRVVVQWCSTYFNDNYFTEYKSTDIFEVVLRVHGQGSKQLETGYGAADQNETLPTPLRESSQAWNKSWIRFVQSVMFWFTTSWNYMKFIEIRQTVKHSLGFCWRFDLLQIGYSLLDVVGALLQWIRKASNLLDGEAVRNVKTPLPPWHFYGLSNTSFGDFNVYTCSYPILAVIRVTARWWAVWGYARYG